MIFVIFWNRGNCFAGLCPQRLEQQVVGTGLKEIRPRALHTDARVAFETKPRLCALWSLHFHASLS